MNNRFNSSIRQPQIPQPQPNLPSQNDDLVFPYCEDVNNYERIVKIGQGTFG